MEKKKSIAERVAEAQDTKEMTRRAIMVLINSGEDASDLCREFEENYGEPVTR